MTNPDVSSRTIRNRNLPRLRRCVRLVHSSKMGLTAMTAIAPPGLRQSLLLFLHEIAPELIPPCTYLAWQWSDAPTTRVSAKIEDAHEHFHFQIPRRYTGATSRLESGLFRCLGQRVRSYYITWN